MKSTSIAIASLFALHLAEAGGSPLTHLLTEQNTDIISTGAGGMRGTGSTQLAVTGVVGTPSRALLFWHGPTNDPTDGPLATIKMNGSLLQGINIGASDDNSWNMSNSQAYMADVTAIVTGDGTYTLSDAPRRNANGASLLIFFDDGVESNNRDIVLFTGNDSNMDNSYDPPGWYFGALGVGYDSGEAVVELHVSDGQDFGSQDDGVLVLNGESIARGGLFQGATVQGNPGTSVRNGKLWDIRRFDVSEQLSSGNKRIILQFDAKSDALSLIAVAIDLPAGSADRLVPVGPKTVVHYGRAPASTAD